jgi:hypothetical protein
MLVSTSVRSALPLRLLPVEYGLIAAIRWAAHQCRQFHRSGRPSSSNCRTPSDARFPSGVRAALSNAGGRWGARMCRKSCLSLSPSSAQTLPMKILESIHRYRTSGKDGFGVRAAKIPMVERRTWTEFVAHWFEVGESILAPMVAEECLAPWHAVRDHRERGRRREGQSRPRSIRTNKR